MKWQRWLAMAGILAGGILLAFPLRGIVNQLIILPLAYLLYALELLYLSLPQMVWWIAIIVVVLIVFGGSLLIETNLPGKIIEERPVERGRVETLASSMKKARKGSYSKWMVANVLGKLAYQIIVQRENGKLRSVFAPLETDGWDPSPEVKEYLDMGFHGSFTDLPRHSWIRVLPGERTALDHDVADVIDFLELKVEGNSISGRH